MFESSLKKLVGEVDGALGAAVLSLDGLVIQAVDELGAACDAELATGEYAQVLKHLARVAEDVHLGRIERFTVAGQRRLGLVRVLSPHYVAVLNLPADGLEERGHFYLRVAAPELSRQI